MTFIPSYFKQGDLQVDCITNHILRKLLNISIATPSLPTNFGYFFFFLFRVFFFVQILDTYVPILEIVQFFFIPIKTSVKEFALFGSEIIFLMIISTVYILIHLFKST